MATDYSHCPKCGHNPLPADQALPAACPGCGVIFAKIGQRPKRLAQPDVVQEDAPRWSESLFHLPQRVDSMGFWLRVALLAGLAVWSVALIRLDHRTGEIGAAFLHRPLLVFHEAGHLLFMAFGEWLTIAGGTIGQLLVPLVLAGALLWKNRDPFGAAVPPTWTGT